MANRTKVDGRRSVEIVVPMNLEAIASPTSLSVEEAVRRLRSYRERNPAVWDLFDKSALAPKDVIEPGDLLSLSALNARATMAEMTSLWQSERRREAEAALAEVTRRPLGELDDAGLVAAATALGRVADILDATEGWGDTRVGKLVYRLRPNLAPIYDAYLGSYYTKEQRASWNGWYEVAMRQIRSNWEPLSAAVAAVGGPESAISPVRAWDILLWLPVAEAVE